MKKIMILWLLSILLFLMVKAESVEAPSINITLMNQDPDPVNPGRYVELRFKIQNTMPDTTAENFQIMLVPEYPFSLDLNEDPLRELGNLPNLGDGKNVVVIKYKVRVDEKAIEGKNPIKIKYKFNGIDWFSQEFDIDVQTIDANIAIMSVETEPDKIIPGQELELKIKIKNMADSVMKDISLKLDLTYSDLISKAVTANDFITAFNSLPFAPVESATEQRIYSLMPNEEKELIFKLITFPDAESKVYKIPIQIQYYDELETKYTKDELIGLVVNAKPDLILFVDESDLYAGKKLGNIVLKFINKGMSDIKFLYAILNETGDFELLSPNVVYVGNIDSDDYETAEFKIYIKNPTKEEKKILLPLDVEYRDANNNLYSKHYDVNLNVFKAEKIGLSKSNNFLNFIFLVLVLSIVFFLIKKRKKSL